MWRTRSKRGFGFLLPFSLLALLLALAVLQYRWTGALSQAEAERLRSGLRASLDRFGGELDFEIGRVLRSLSLHSASELPEALADLKRDARYPGIISEVYRLDFEGHHHELARLEENGAVPESSPPPYLHGLRERIEAMRRSNRGRPRGGGGPPLALVSSDPLAIVTLTRPERGARPAAAVVVFRNEVVAGELLPDVAARVFGSEETRDYDIAVVDDSGRVVFSTRDDASEVIESADASSGLLSPRPPGGRRPPGPPPPELPREEGPWTVYVRHRDGSLEAVVGRARTRNLALGTGVLFLLGGSIVLLTVSARRAMELSERKMEFVAGVSHELRTPLAVIRSAAQNLADGSVEEAPQVRRYGGLIEAEGRRLEDLVENVLELAGVTSTTRRSVRERVAATVVVRSAIADNIGESRERGVEMEIAAPEAEVFVLGDEGALRRGVANLVGNALKHGGDGNAVKVSIERRSGEVSISVSDRGPGIPPSEVPHLFDAFYRGRRARDGQVRGSGLGLRLVQQIAREHGGRVEVDSQPGKGSRFSLVLPEAS